MTDQSPTREIVVGVDGSAPSAAAITWAAQNAATRGVPLRLVHVVPPFVPASSPIDIPIDYLQAEEDQARRIVEDARKLATEAASAHHILQISTEVITAPIVATLVELSKTAEMVVVGCVGEGAVARVLLGSVSSGLVHHAHCPVAIIHTERTPSPQAPVLVGIDGSPASEQATAIAFDEASRRGVDLVALHAWTDMGPLEFPPPNWAPIEWANIKESEEEVLAERLSGWRDRYPDVTVHRVLVSDRPIPRLLEHADTAQLVVVGSHGRGGFSDMVLGSVSSAIAHSAEIPVIVARSN